MGGTGNRRLKLPHPDLPGQDVRPRLGQVRPGPWRHDENPDCGCGSRCGQDPGSPYSAPVWGGDPGVLGPGNQIPQGLLETIPITVKALPMH